MNEKQIKAYVAALQPILKLQDWEIRVEMGKCDPDAWAQNFSSPRYKKSTIRINAEVLAGNCEENIKAILIHELLHLYTAQAHKQVEYLMDKHESERDRLLDKVIDDLIEALIDPISEVIESLIEVEL